MAIKNVSLSVARNCIPSLCSYSDAFPDKCQVQQRQIPVKDQSEAPYLISAGICGYIDPVKRGTPKYSSQITQSYIR